MIYKLKTREKKKGGISVGVGFELELDLMTVLQKH